MRTFADRHAAGLALAAALPAVAHDAVVLGLPRGGVVVAAAVATARGLRLDALGVRKVGVPGHRELAAGAVASGGIVVRNEEVVAARRIDADTMAELEARASAELAAAEVRWLPPGWQHEPLHGHTCLVVDDGLATGSTAEAALLALRSAGADRTVLAVPVGPPGTVRRLRQLADDVVVLRTPARFGSVSRSYRDFTATSDDDVRRLLLAGRP